MKPPKDKSKLQEGYKACHQNALEHFRAAELLKENDIVGNSVAHLILSAEELIKGIALFLLSFNYEKVNSLLDYDLLFKDHKIKHKGVKELYFTFHILFLMSEKLDDLKDFEGVQKFLKQFDMEFSPDKEFNLEHFLRELYAKLMLNEKKQQVDAENEHRAEMDKLWNEANNLKNACFYVEDQNGKFLSPDRVNPETYDSYHLIVHNLIKSFDIVIMSERFGFDKEKLTMLQTIECIYDLTEGGARCNIFYFRRDANEDGSGFLWEIEFEDFEPPKGEPSMRRFIGIFYPDIGEVVFEENESLPVEAISKLGKWTSQNMETISE